MKDHSDGINGDLYILIKIRNIVSKNVKQNLKNVTQVYPVSLFSLE